MPKKKLTPKSKRPFWVCDVDTEGMSQGTLSAVGPFESRAAAETWICESSANDWVTSCGCLRRGDPATWGSEHIILQEVRRVVPVPPDTASMTLRDVTANAKVVALPPQDSDSK